MCRRCVFLAFLPAIGLRAGLFRRALPRFMIGMVEHVMPRMMGHCFALLHPDQRRFMLAHCRGMLDEIEAKYERTDPPPQPDPVSA